MSKRALKKYLKELEKEQLEEQIIDLYERFDEVRTFYNFVFDPKEDKLLKDAKFRISKEYFPVNNRKPKARRSVAHKFIRHFLKLGVAPEVVADIMLFNLEIAQSYSAEKEKSSEAFEKSMFKSFEQAAEFIIANHLSAEFQKRLKDCAETAVEQGWNNDYRFKKVLQQFL